MSRPVSEIDVLVLSECLDNLDYKAHGGLLVGLVHKATGLSTLYGIESIIIDDGLNLLCSFIFSTFRIHIAMVSDPATVDVLM